MAVNDYYFNIMDPYFTLSHADNPPEGKWKESHLYSVWRDMKIRCYGKNSPNYKNYGGRGISMDPKWKDDYPAFYRWAESHGYREGLQLDRINTNKNYSPENCRFVTQSENLSNRRHYTIPNRDDHISHHGRLGQKWGEKNGPPYPLYRTGRYGAGEKAAGPKYKTDKFPKETQKSANATSESKISKTNAGTQMGPSSRVRNGLTETPYTKDVNNVSADGKPMSQFGMKEWHSGSDGSDMWSETVGYQSGLCNYNDFTHKEVTKTQFTDEDGDTVTRWVNPATLIAADDSYLRTAPDSDSSGHSHSNGQVTDDDMTDCNPEGNTTSNRDNNCIKCTAALELRMRGYDISAGRAYGGGRYNCQNFWFNGAKTEGCSTPDEAKDLISSYGNGASGELHIEWGKNTGTRGGGAHSIHWTTDNTGKFEIQDGQTGERYDSIDDYMKKHTNAWDNMNVTRLDNCEPNWEAIGNDSVVRSNPRTTDAADRKILNTEKFNEYSSGYSAAESTVETRRNKIVKEVEDYIDNAADDSDSGTYLQYALQDKRSYNYANDDIRDAYETGIRGRRSNKFDRDQEAAKKFLKDAVTNDPVGTIRGRSRDLEETAEDMYREAPDINDYLSDDY